MKTVSDIGPNTTLPAYPDESLIRQMEGSSPLTYREDIRVSYPIYAISYERRQGAVL